VRGRVAAWSFGVACGLVVSVASAARAQLPAADALCRSRIGKGVKRVTDAVIKQRSACELLRIRGAIPATINCGSPVSAPADAKIITAKLKLTSLVQKGCAGASSASANGYLACPAPCDGVSIADYQGVAACMSCLADDWPSAAVESAYGTPEVLPLNPAEATCQRFVGTALRKYFTTRMGEQQKCQLAKDRGQTTVDCVSADPKGKVARARQKARDTIARCEPDVFANLEGCGSDLASLQACVLAASNVDADALFYAVYFPAVPTPTPTGTRIDTLTPTPTPTPVTPSTATPSDTPTPTATPTALPPVHVDINAFPPANPNQYPCFIFVHGKRTDTGTYTNWNDARDYWKSGSRDFIQVATKNFAASYYVVGYNGTQAYWDAQAAGEVANEIVNATNGGPDGGGNRCARTYDEGGTFWVVGHSMAGSVMDYILGNDDPSDPNYNLNGPYDVAAARVSLVITLGGTHRGSQGADLVCGGGNPFCSFFAQFVQSCDTATYWLRSSDDVQVRTYANAPAKTVWLTSGYAAIVGASLCLSGEDDGIVQHASSFACNGSATASYDNGNVCDNGNKQESSGFMNLDTGHENHDSERNDSTRDTRQAIPTGIWICNGSACNPGSDVQGSMSTGQLVGTLY
jgi:hypothetical protein